MLFNMQEREPPASGRQRTWQQLFEGSRADERDWHRSTEMKSLHVVHADSQNCL
jgi:hypothetical protein